jgi:teichuronic acid biosynthesis glycosyltransferase TuaH
MKKKFDIIINTLFRTDNAYSSVSLSMAKEFAKTHRVFYLNHPYSVKDMYTERNSPFLRQRLPNILRGKLHYEKLPEIPENFWAVTPPPTVPVNFLNEGFVYDTFYRYNQNLMVKAVRQIVKDHKLTDFIYLTCYDPFFLPVLPKDVGAALSIYQCIDDISTEAYVSKHGVRLEAEAVGKSDIALVTSTNLHRFYKPIQPHTHIIHNAVDISIFKNLYYRNDIERPAEIAHVKNKIIGFIGNLDPIRTDYPLMKHLALAHPDKTLLLVGPNNAPELAELGIDKLPNVIMTGAKKIYEVPLYLKFIDVAILPSLLNKMSKSVYPLKINEYLAAGKSCIATNFSEDIRAFSPTIRIAQSHEDFAQLINDAADDYSSQKVAERMRIAEGNTWGDRIREFWSIVEAHLEPQSEKKSIVLNS